MVRTALPVVLSAILGRWEGRADELLAAAQVSAPLLVALDNAAAGALRTEAEGAGWTTVDVASREAVGRLVVIDDLAGRGVAFCVAVAAAGSGVLVSTVGASAELVDELLEDLSRLGRVVIARATDVPVLDVDTWRLLHALRDGATVAEAASTLHVSLRTANRRLSRARTELGADTRGEVLRALSSPDRIRSVDG